LHRGFDAHAAGQSVQRHEAPQPCALRGDLHLRREARLHGESQHGAEQWRDDGFAQADRRDGGGWDQRVHGDDLHCTPVHLQ
jgi:hypothetical protein